VNLDALHEQTKIVTPTFVLFVVLKGNGIIAQVKTLAFGCLYKSKVFQRDNGSKLVDTITYGREVAFCLSC